MERTRYRLALLSLTGALLVWARADAQNSVDFGYAPPLWQSSICLPDDPCKSLVSRSGAMLYDYHKGPKGRDFATKIGMKVEHAEWQSQELESPRVPIVRTRYASDGLEYVEEAFALTSAQAPARIDMELIRVTNSLKDPHEILPVISVETSLAFTASADGQAVVVDGRELVTASLKITRVEKASETIHLLHLDALTVPAGGSAEFFVLHHENASAANAAPKTLAEAHACREHAVTWWTKEAGLPFDRVHVPDPQIQALFDSSTRNIWQAREIKDNLPAFQVGPTCYRGLWIVDGAFILEAATILGAGDQARNGVAYELTHQKPDGRIEVMKDYPKENGIVLWTCLRHAQLTQDKPWLESVWPKLVRIAEYIRQLREQTRTSGTALDTGLMPPGFPDGGIAGVQDEYTNAYWNLLGLHAFVEAAHWLGHHDEAERWQREYGDFLSAFRKAARRDMLKDPAGNSYLPILMGAKGAKELPQRGQWGFCHAVYPGQIFAKDDPLVAGNLAMLQATEREGMVYGTGWDATGIWNYFASFYGHAWLWQGNGRKAAEVLYAFANHAAPVLDWREEQSLKGDKFHEVGDMPHNWASAEFIRLTVHLLALDRGDELHLFEGLPTAWTQPGMVTELNGIATPFGKLTMRLQISNDGKSRKLHLEPLMDPSCRKIVVHLGGWASDVNEVVVELSPSRVQDMAISMEATSKEK